LSRIIAGKGLQLRRAIGIQATKKKDYLRTMLSRHQLQAFVRQRGDKIINSKMGDWRSNETFF